MNALVKEEPRILRGSTPADREARGQQLANLVIREMVPLLVQVRQDFLDKDQSELICGCRTFTEYCNGVLHYSESHIRRLIAGHNPATKFDGSKNRKPDMPQPPAVAELTVKDLMDWYDTMDDEGMDQISFHRRIRECNGTVDMIFHAIDPSTAKTLAESYLRLMKTATT
ncbi:MAG TPA: hypothetical protein VGT24_13150 [Candidatus Acidoferrales bacterium]|nr:hypothetical protein [Candidatus Acidoferrales bacterium]